MADTFLFLNLSFFITIFFKFLYLNFIRNHSKLLNEKEEEEKAMMIYNLTHHKTVTFRCVATYVSNIMKNRLQPDSHWQKEMIKRPEFN